MGRYSREERLARALPDGRARVDAQVAESGVQTHPERVKGRHGRLVLVGQLGRQVHDDLLPVLVEVVRYVPLWEKKIGKLKPF